MAEMIKLFVNGEEVEVESGKNLIDAIGAVGIEIPHLCYHPALGADGNCRMCLVGIEDGRPPLVPACKTPAMEGMKVQLDTDKIKKIQQDVMEFELINHPIDCPVCDQAGECSLQDYYMKYDFQSSRMRVPQVKKGKKMDFGCGVVHDQERCVLCGRCVRFCRQITQTGELGIVNRTDYTRVTIFPGRPLDNKYALNVVDLCPVGAMTSADFRFKQRVWFLSKNKGVCHGCAKGCSIYVDHNREKYKDDIIYRFRPRHNDLINGYFMCDEGRLSYTLENENRLTTPLKKGKSISFNDAFEKASKLLEKAEKPVILLSPDLSLEQMVAMKAFAADKGGTIFGLCDGYLGEGDEYLIQQDKAANRKGLELLGISNSTTDFVTALEGADLLINCNNEQGMKNKGVDKSLRDTPVLFLATHASTLADSADIAIPVASYTEYSGSVINCDNVLQTFSQAVRKNEPPMDIAEIAALLGGPLGGADQIAAELKKIVAFAQIDFNEIPDEGMKLS